VISAAPASVTLDAAFDMSWGVLLTADRTPDEPREPGNGPVDAGRLWAGGIATAVVAGLIAVVGIVMARGIFHVAVLAPKGSGTWGNANTATYAAAAFGVGLLATGLIHLLLLSTPAPFTFFGWIMGLCVLAAVVAPFGTDADLAPKVSTAIINAAIGIAIWSLTVSSARRSLRVQPRVEEDF
jgi:Family of unknown function (DUF6069)